MNSNALHCKGGGHERDQSFYWVGKKGSNWACPVLSDSWLRDNFVWFGFKIDRALVVKARVESGTVIEGLDVIEDGDASLGKGREAMVID